MRKLRLCLTFLALLLAVPALAANTETQNGNSINVILDGTTDWDSRTNHPGGLPLTKMVFLPSIAGDIMTVRQNGASGNIIFPGKSLDGEPRQLDFSGTVLWKPYIKASDCTLGTPASAKLILYLK